MQQRSGKHVINTGFWWIFHIMMRCNNTVGTSRICKALTKTHMEELLAQVTTPPNEQGASHMAGLYENPNVFHRRPPMQRSVKDLTTSPSELAACPNGVPLGHDNFAKFQHTPWASPMPMRHGRPNAQNACFPAGNTKGGSTPIVEACTPCTMSAQHQQ